MPVRSLSSSVLKWPSAAEVEAAVQAWAQALAAHHPEVRRVGYFGSLTRGDWGVGSDVDMVVVVSHTEEPPPRRAARWPVEDLPVPADVLVYTEEEWKRMDPNTRFGRVLREEVRWVYVRD